MRESVVQARGADELTGRLRAQGEVVLSVREIRPAWAGQLREASRARLRRRQGLSYPLFCREIRTLVLAGMTIVEAVETLSARERLEGRQDSLSARLLERLQQGQTLSRALAALPSCPPVLVAAVRAGERTSNLVEALDDYLRFESLIGQLRRKVASAAIYPGVVAALGLGISVFLLMVVMPNFARMYQNLRGASAEGAGWVIGASQWVAAWRAEFFAALLLAAAALAIWAAGGGLRRLGAAVARRVPLVGARLKDFRLAMMYQALALLLKGGYTMTEAMDVAAQASLAGDLRVALEAARQRVAQGGSVAQALAAAGLCDEVGRRLMAAAERNGDFHRAASVVAGQHGERFELFVERMARVAEPLLLLAVALAVGTLVVAMYLPIFDMARQI
ncbi:MAG: type II secretion system F family protein [Comamonas sp.]